MPATCAFCAIISGDQQAATVLQTERLIAFLDHRPLFRGHTLLVPKRHVRLLSDLPADWALEFFTTAHRLELADGIALAYEQLVIATGSKPRMLPAFAPYQNVSTLRTLEDSRAIREMLAARARLLIIGAGFIGQEVASGARAAGVEVTVVEA